MLYFGMESGDAYQEDLCLDEIEKFITGLYDGDLHAKRNRWSGRPPASHCAKQTTHSVCVGGLRRVSKDHVSIIDRITASGRPSYDPKEPRGKSGFHSRPFAVPVLQNTGSVLFGIVLWKDTRAPMLPKPNGFCGTNCCPI